MDWCGKFEELKGEISALSNKADKMAQAYAEAEDFTRKFLARCSAHKIKLVSIGFSTDLIEGCKSYPWGCEGSVFAEGRAEDGFPAIWSVVEELGISGGAGNGYQHQVSRDAQSKLVDGLYEFKNKKWHKIR
jgi:hypothetical protein